MQHTDPRNTITYNGETYINAVRLHEIVQARGYNYILATIRRYITDGIVPSITIGRSRWVRLADIQASDGTPRWSPPKQGRPPQDVQIEGKR